MLLFYFNPNHNVSIIQSTCVTVHVFSAFLISVFRFSLMFYVPVSVFSESPLFPLFLTGSRPTFIHVPGSFRFSVSSTHFWSFMFPPSLTDHTPPRHSPRNYPQLFHSVISFSSLYSCFTSYSLSDHLTLLCFSPAFHSASRVMSVSCCHAFSGFPSYDFGPVYWVLLSRLWGLLVILLFISWSEFFPPSEGFFVLPAFTSFV